MRSVNFVNLKSQECLRQIKLKLCHLIDFLMIRLQVFLSPRNSIVNLPSEKPIPGYIQYFVKNPFIIHLYTKRQIEVLKSLTRCIILHLDIRLHYQQTSILHETHILICTNSTTSDYHIAPIPVGETINSDQGTAK